MDRIYQVNYLLHIQFLTCKRKINMSELTTINIVNQVNPYMYLFFVFVSFVVPNVIKGYICVCIEVTEP